MKHLKIIKVVFVSISALVILCCIRTFLLTAFQRKAPETCHVDEKEGYIYANDSWKEFKKSLEIQSVSYSPGEYNRRELKRLLDFILQSMFNFFLN